MIILASASPRRKELLKQIGCSFKVEVSQAEEIMSGDMAPVELVQDNARSKALAVWRNNPQQAVLGADTVVVVDGEIFGKPHDEAEAASYLRRLSGRAHQVITGVALCQKEQVLTEAVVTEVVFAAVSDSEIREYIATGEPMDKAGAYAIQGRAAAFIEGIRGSFSNVVGLPLRAVVKLAEKAGVDLYGNACP